MDIVWIVVIAVCCVAGLLLLLSMSLALVIVKLPFSKRCDKNPLLKYFTAADFNLKAKPVETPYFSNKKKKLSLRGYLYMSLDGEKREKVIVFCHGMGAGQIAYTTEIARFVSDGFDVLALDNEGCNLSDGKKIGGLHKGIAAAEAAVDYADGLGYQKIYLVGHSWGGYSALCASRSRRVEGVVAMSAPDRPASVLSEGARGALPSFLVALAHPFILLFLSGKNMHAAECARYADAPVLLIQGDKDNTVPPKCAAYYKAFGQNITKLLAEGKAHNPYNTQKAEEELQKLMSKLSEAGKTKKPDRAFFKNFDFAAATEEDDKIMDTIAKFLSEN